MQVWHGPSVGQGRVRDVVLALHIRAQDEDRADDRVHRVSWVEYEHLTGQQDLEECAHLGRLVAAEPRRAGGSPAGAMRAREDGTARRTSDRLRAPIRSRSLPGFRMPCREQAVELGGRGMRDAQVTGSGACAPPRSAPADAGACGDSGSLTSSTTAVLPGLLCSLPTKSRRVWADCRTKAFALAVDITNSHRSPSPESPMSTDRRLVERQARPAPCLTPPARPSPHGPGPDTPRDPGPALRQAPGLKGARLCAP